MKIIYYSLLLLIIHSCGNKEDKVNEFKFKKNGLYFKEYFISKEDKNDTLISLSMSLDTALFYYKIRDDIPVHFLMRRNQKENFLYCSVDYKWEESNKKIWYNSRPGFDEVGNLSQPFEGGLRISGAATFIMQNGSIKLLSNDLSTGTAAITHGLGKKLKDFTGQDLIYSSCIVDSDSIYLVSYDKFKTY
ncbi:MAG: hypothetical protein ACXWCR_07760 [Flavitalea sp.]